MLTSFGHLSCSTLWRMVYRSLIWCSANYIKFKALRLSDSANILGRAFPARMGTDWIS